MTTTITTPRINNDVRLGILAMLRSVVQAQVVATTIAVNAVAQTFTRADGGSFKTDGFVDGAELTSSGFSNACNNGLSYIRAVTDSVLTVEQIPVKVAGVSAGTTLVTEAAGQNATLSLSWPSQRDYARGFSATAGVPWVRLTMLRAPNSNERTTIGVNPTRREKGWADATLFYPRDYGESAAESMADAVRVAANNNEILTTPANRLVYLIDPTTGRGGASVLTPKFDGLWYQLPVRIPWHINET